MTIKYELFKDKVLSIICGNGTLGMPIKAARIAATLNVYKRSDTTSPIVRKAISDLIKDGHPIGSNSNGFFIIESEEGFRVAMEWLETKTVGNLKRMELIKKAYRGVGGSKRQTL